jgi:hypothetical protein
MLTGPFSVNFFGMQSINLGSHYLHEVLLKLYSSENHTH